MKPTFLALLLLVASPSALAQTEERADMVEWTLSPLSRDGKLVGCSFEFNAVVAPSMLAGGSALGITGSLGFEFSEQTRHGYLKGGVLAFTADAPKGKGLPIQTFHLNLDGTPVEVFKTLDGERVGFKVSALAPKKAADAFVALLEARSIRWAFKLPNRRYDQIVLAGQPIPEQERLQAVQCMRAVASRFDSKPGKS